MNLVRASLATATVLAALVALPASARSQAEPAEPPTAIRRAAPNLQRAVERPAPQPAVAPDAPGKADRRGDLAVAGGGDHAAAAGGFHNGRIAALFFWFFALITLGGGVFVITRKNPISAVMGMVGTFFGLAGLYLMLYASFLAAIQVLVYAGAIMVLFVFVVMFLNRAEEEPWSVQGLLGKAIAAVALAYLVMRLGGVLWDIKDSAHAIVAAPRPVYEIAAGDPGDFGSVRAVGNTLFRGYLFPFEAVSLVLLAAVVGAIAVARPHVKDDAAVIADGPPKAGH